MPARVCRSASRPWPIRSVAARPCSAAGRADPSPRAGRRTRACRRHAGADPGQGQGRDRAAWVYVRDDRPFGGRDPPAALFHFSRDRSGEHAERHLDGFTGVLQADAFAGFNRLYTPTRRPGPLVEAACWAHARRRFFVLADVTAKACGRLPVLAPLALAAVERIDAIFAIEREINGLDIAATPCCSAGAPRNACDWAGDLDASRAGAALAPCRRGQGF